MTKLQLLQELCDTPAISGFEKPVREIMIRELADNYKRDRLGSIVFEHKGSSDDPKLLFVGHMDEVGFIVFDITEKGLIKVQPIGGWDPGTLMSQSVEIINNKGEKVYGVFGSIPKHYLKKGESASVDMDALFIDIGAASAEEAENVFHVTRGNAIVPHCIPNYTKETNRLFHKAFDNRVGIGAAIELGKAIEKMDHPNTIYCAGSVQEEVGVRGAQVITSIVKPDIAFILEGPPADDTIGQYAKSTPQTCVGKGVHVRLYDPSMLVHQGLCQFVIDTAKENDIPIQMAVRKGGGTDGARIHLAHEGIPSIVLGVPVRYAHSHIGSISMDDYENLIRLITVISRKFDAKTLQSILDY